MNIAHQHSLRSIFIEKYAAWFCIGIAIPMIPFLAHAVPDLITRGTQNFWRLNLEETYLFVTLSAATAAVESRLSRGGGTLVFGGYLVAGILAAMMYLQLITHQNDDRHYLLAMTSNCSAHRCGAKAPAPTRPDPVSGGTEQAGVVLMFSTGLSYMIYKWIVLLREAKSELAMEELLRSVQPPAVDPMVRA